jgi:hypothetical protein
MSPRLANRAASSSSASQTLRWRAGLKNIGLMNRSPATLSRLNAAIGGDGLNSPAARSTPAAWISEDSEVLYCSLGVVVVRFMPWMSSAASSEGVRLVVSREAMHCPWPDWVVLLLLLASSASEEG